MQATAPEVSPVSPALHLERFLTFYFSHPAFNGEADPWIRFVALASAARKERVAEKEKSGEGKAIHSFPMEGSIFQSETEAKLAVIHTTNQKALYDCYYVVNKVRLGLGTKSCENSDVVRRLFLPLDFDYRLPCSIGELLGEFGLGASAIIQTSMREGYPRYQILFSLDAEEVQDVAAIGILAQQMCQVFGSDVVHDAKRIMRLPGTVNWKGNIGASGGKAVPMVSWCKIIDGLGGLVPENIWLQEEITDCLAKFAESALAKDLAKLSREHSMTKEAVGAARKKEKAASARKSGKTKERDNSEFGWWEDAITLAEKGKASVRSGARHPAMTSWMGQMLRGGIISSVVFQNLYLLAEKACSPSFLGEDDFKRMLQYVEKYRGKLQDEVKLGFMSDNENGDVEENPAYQTAPIGFFDRIETTKPISFKQKKEKEEESTNVGESETDRRDDGETRSDEPQGEAGSAGHIVRPEEAAGADPGSARTGEGTALDEVTSSSSVANAIKDLEETLKDEKTYLPGAPMDETGAGGNGVREDDRGRAQGSGNRPEVANHVLAGDPSQERGREEEEKDASGEIKQVVESSGVGSTVKDMEERQQVAILRFKDASLDYLFTKEALDSGRHEKELIMLVMSVVAWNMHQDETPFVEFFVRAFRGMNCFTGNFCSARAEVVTPWGSRAVTRAPMSELELLAVVDAWMLKLVRKIREHEERLATIPTLKAVMKETLTDREQRKVSLRVKKISTLVSSISRGMSRRLGGSFGTQARQPNRTLIFQDGVFDLESGRFAEDANASVRYSNPVQTRYTEASPDRNGAWNKFLERAFPGDEGTKELIYRMIGYMATVDTAAQKIFWLQGISGSGKSSLAGVILALLGQQNITVTRIQTVAGDFGLGGCENKTLCLIEEAENADPKIRNNAFGRLKEAASGNPVTLQKKHENERSVILPTKFLLLSNKDLGLDDAGGGTMRRLVPIKFEAVVPVDKVRPDGELRADILSEADSIMSESARRFSVARKHIASAFDVRESIALSRGKEDTRAELQGVSVILDEIIESCDSLGQIPLPSAFVQQVVIAVAAERGVSLKARHADKILKDMRPALENLGASFKEDSRAPDHRSKYSGYSGVRFKQEIWERLPWGQILSALKGHARQAAELLCKQNKVPDTEIDARPGIPSLSDEPFGVDE